MEIWKNIVGYEGLYQVSNLGRIRSLDRISKRNSISTRRIRGTIMKTHKYTNGYLFISLCKDGEKKHFLIHRLVAMAFIPCCTEGYEVNHKNEKKTDNCVDNLEWITHKQNINYGTMIERRTLHSNFKGINNPMFGRKGANNPNSKPVLQFDLNGNLIRRWDCAKDIKRELGFNDSSIVKVAKGKQKTSYGFIWKYNI